MRKHIMVFPFEVDDRLLVGFGIEDQRRNHEPEKRLADMMEFLTQIP